MFFDQEIIFIKHYGFSDFPGRSDGEASADSAGDLSSVSGLGKSPAGGKGYPLQYSCLENSMGEGNGNPLQYSCLANPMDRGAC